MPRSAELGQRRGHLPLGRTRMAASVLRLLPPAQVLASASLLLAQRGLGTRVSPELNRWPQFQCPTSLGSAPLRVLENVQRKQEAAGPVWGTGLGRIVSPRLSCSPKILFLSAEQRFAAHLNRACWCLLPDTLTSAGRLCQSIPAAGHGNKCFSPPVPTFRRKAGEGLLIQGCCDRMRGDGLN